MTLKTLMNFFISSLTSFSNPASKRLASLLLICFIINNSDSFCQTAVATINTTYITATTGSTYTATGAALSPNSGSTFTYNFGNLSGSASNNRQLNNFVAGGSSYAFVTMPGQYVKIKRVDNPVVTGIRSLRYSEGDTAGGVVNIVNEYNDNMEVFFNGNTNFNSGSDNLFANQGDGNGNNNNIERLDVIFPSGVSASDNTKLGFSVFERGAVNAHDPIKVAVITSIDGSGNPTGYTSIISLTSANYGSADPVASANYVIFRRDTASEPKLKISTTTNQGIAGVFIKLSDFGLANNTTIYGYSIIPNDFTGSTSADIIAYTNTTLYPANTSAATGTGGIDLVSATGAFQSGSVVNRSISGNVYNDVNGLNNSLVDGTGSNAGGVNAVLVNTSGNVVASVAVASDGSYTFGSIANGTYTVRLSTTAGTTGSAAPAVSLPSGWVNTGEGTTTAGDGTVNGITNSFTFSGTNMTGVNFGIEQPPTPSVILGTSQVNPGGTTVVTVTAATFGATDMNGGTIASIRISAFPTNATTITINGTSYTSGTFPGGGVSVPTGTTGQPTQTISIDPIDGAITSVITYYATDNASKESSTTGTASMPFTTVTVSGNVYNDVNGMTNSLVDGTGTNGGGVNAILVDNSGNVTATVAVSAGGTYTFPSVSGGTYTVRLSTTAGTVGSAAPAVSFPSGWVSTGEGTTSAGDGTVNGITNTFTVTTANITAVNFGIEQPPTPSVILGTSQVNPGGTTAVTVPAATFGATDMNGGTIASIRISAFPTNATTITINGTSYTSGTFPGGGVSVPTGTTGQPTQTISIDPIDGAITSVITYYATDNASKESSTTGTASMPFTTVTVSGNVYNDVNGMTNSLVDGTGTNAGGVNAILVNSGGNVAATAVVSAGGTYTFPSVNGGTYTVRISTATATIGLTAPAVVLPIGWISTGEGTTAAGDGTVNGITNTFTISSSNITGVNFGIQLRDSDKDGIADINDIDDDNDGIPDLVESGTYDALGDTDGDGIANYLDATPGTGQPAFTDANSDGINDYYDTDKDGIINNLDLDTDNDGIADIVEAGGIDTNGDGRVDILTDTDGDGLVDTYDITNGGVNIANLDTDGDGVPNFKDLDSDNDGIPDVVEAYGADINNDGLIDSYTDTDSDGFSDNVDGDVGNDGTSENTTNALIITSTAGGTAGRPATYPRANADGTGLPNPYDLDSDGDGITDATESGITAASYNSGMTSGCTLVNGWCTLIDALASLNLTNTDGTGRADLYDIDADNDGITDNIEAQATGSYIVPTDADTDGDGVADVYDSYNGMGANGLTAYDHDADGTPDYIDTDTDNDGAFDRNEADKNNATLSQATINSSGDTDGDGLMDIFDTYNIVTQTSNFYINVSNSNMGPLGNWNGPMPDGSNVSLVQSASGAANRDWRNVSLLGLSFLNLTGSRSGNEAQLIWSVQNEQEMVSYIVERSFDGLQFDSVGHVTSAQKAYSQYHFSDVINTEAGKVSYYRIKQTAINGEVVYSHILQLKADNKANTAVSISPNPVDNLLKLKINLPVRTMVAISIIDVTGKELIRQQTQGQQGDNLMLTQVNALKSSIYIVKVCTGNECYTEMLVKK